MIGDVALGSLMVLVLIALLAGLRARTWATQHVVLIVGGLALVVWFLPWRSVAEWGIVVVVLLSLHLYSYSAKRKASAR
jgi:hypothetical protein